VQRWLLGEVKTLHIFGYRLHDSHIGPKKPLILPKVINVADIKKLFEVTTNLKHHTMLKLCYGMGLRVSEIVNLKVTDVDSKNM